MSVDTTARTQTHRSAAWIWLKLAALVVLAVIAIGLPIIAHYAEPILRERVIETLSARFHARVELPSFHVSVTNGFQVYGGGLKIFANFDPNSYEPGIQPIIAVQEFQFRAGILNLLHTPMRIHRVYLQGLDLNIPPRGEREIDLHLTKIKNRIYVDEFVCEEARLIINTARPDKLPLEFDIRQLTMRQIAPGEALRFDATLINPKPVGEIQSSGFFGPWHPDEPRDTPVKGDYAFSHADLGTIKGIGGILSSTGTYEGTLGGIVVEGKTETPDFRIAISGHPEPLKTEFHATVDGTSGDTYLEPVNATLPHSHIVARGSIVRVKDPNGHRVLLNVLVKPARIEDLLQLGVRTNPPVMSGAAELTTRFDLSPGPADLTDRLRLNGSFRIIDAHFSNPKVQDKVDALSLRSNGKPKEANAGDAQEVSSDMTGTFSLREGLLSFSHLRFDIPGTTVTLAGDYSLDGKEFDFHGKARMKAKLSQMMTGWKSVLLKPVDPFFSKHGTGTELPIKVTGTQSAPHFGLDFGHKDTNVRSKMEGPGP
jgi:AsmA-like C-terminal region